jgi:FkbH-like protein
MDEVGRAPQHADGGAAGLRAQGDAQGVGDAETIKLVVWDLDDTLWRGTLSEGPVDLDLTMIDVVRNLNRRGIVNSICSKNDESQVRDYLERLGLWNEFVFASIDWTPKGPRIAQLIEDAQLRPDNVLFIDDLVINQEEVRYSVPGIRTAGPEIVGRLLSLSECAGKDDSGLSRLRQYQLLERKVADRKGAPGANEQFLRSCNIRIRLFTDPAIEADRLYELVMRTNQLNFTKRRPNRSEFDAMIKDPRIESGYVHVIDRYGDYGICGFYSIDRAKRELVDFLFSCRVLDMGVERWLYQQLGRPKFDRHDLVGQFEGEVDWITVDEGKANETPSRARPRVQTPDPAWSPQNRVLMMGGCDLHALAGYLSGDIITDFSRTASSGAFMHVEHTQILRQARAGLSNDQLALVDRLPFVDREAFLSKPIFSQDYDVLVYSVLMNYTQALYTSRETGLVVPWDRMQRDATDPREWATLEERYGEVGIDRQFLEWMSNKFQFTAGTSPDAFADDIRWLAESVPDGVRIVFLNGAEVPLENPHEPGRHEHHRRMNAVLDKVVATLPNATICDVRKFVRSPADVMADIRHYRRRIYLPIAAEIQSVGAPSLTVHRRSLNRILRRRKKRTLRRLRRILGRTRRRLSRAALVPAALSRAESESDA